MKNYLHTSWCLLALLVAFSGAGCNTAGRTDIEASGAFRPLEATPCALLSVRSLSTGRSYCAPLLWGVYEAANAEGRFADMLTDAAREAGLPLMSAWDAHVAITDAGLPVTLQPAPSRLAEYAEAVGCERYLVAEIANWGYRHILFLPRAHLGFTLTCYEAANQERQWQIVVDASHSGMTDLEIGPAVLAETFQFVRRKSHSTPVVEVVP